MLICPRCNGLVVHELYERHFVELLCVCCGARVYKDTPRPVNGHSSVPDPLRSLPAEFRYDDILLRCMERYQGYHLKLPLYRYFRHGANLTSQEERVEHYNQRLASKHGEDAWAKGLNINPGLGPDIGGQR